MPIFTCPLELKSLSPEGVFEGLASTYGNVDEGGDECVAGCFTETLKSNSQKPLLADHRDPIGVVTLADSAAGLKCKGKLTLGVQKAREVYELMKDGAITGLSIGYQVVGDRGAEIKNGIRYLKNLKLYEVSTTWAPMNAAAQISHVKSAQQEQQIQTALDEFRRDILNAF